MVYTTANRRRSRSRFEAPEECFDYVVRDPEGRKIGRVKEVFTNARDEPQYVKVRVGLFGLRTVLIPVCFVAVDERRRTLTLH
jgi:PRC-barrel domain